MSLSDNIRIAKELRKSRLRTDSSVLLGKNNPRVSLSCVHFGGLTGETVECDEGCGKGTYLKTFHCTKHGVCTPQTHGKAVACCKTCDDKTLVLPTPSTTATNPSRPRILFASHDLSRTGAPRILANVIPHLRGIDPIVYSPCDGPLRADITRMGIPTVTTLNLDGIDAVVANTILSAPVVRAARSTGIPCAWLIHESDPSMCGNLPDVRDVIESPQHVIFPCEATAQAYSGLRRDYSIVPSIVPPALPGNRGHVRISMGVDPDTFLVITMGHDEPRKGHADIRAAVAGMRDVKFVAVHGQSDVSSWYDAANLYVCSSRIEAYPLSLQEAKQHRLPAITTPVFGAVEIIRDGIDGLHYAPGDITDLREKINRIRSDTELRARLSYPLTHLPTFVDSVEQYEQLFLSLTGTGKQSIRVVYHSAGMGNFWKVVVREQLELLASVGLTEVHNTHVGDDPYFVQDEAARLGIKLVMCQYEPDVKNWEVPAMRLIQRMTRNDDTPILYIHTKGVSHDPISGAVYHDWRRLMQQELIKPWRKHARDLSQYDLIGVNWWRNYEHFSGNFWLTRADWVRKLPPFDSIYRDRYSCERWIGMARNPRVKSLVCTQKSFWVPGADQDVMYAALNGPTNERRHEPYLTD